MLKLDSNLFVQNTAQSNRRVLYPAIVAEIAADTYTVCFNDFEEDPLVLEENQPLFIYYDHKGQFVQQPAQIDAVVQTEPILIITLHTSGSVFSAESCQYYRVPIIMTDLTAMVDDKEECPLMDVSVTGFSVVSAEQYNLGHIVSVTLQFETEVFTGQACVQSIRQLKSGRIRYGIHAI